MKIYKFVPAVIIPWLAGPFDRLFVGFEDHFLLLIKVSVHLHSPTVRVSPMAVSLKQGEMWTEMFLCLFSNLKMKRDESCRN